MVLTVIFTIVLCAWNRDERISEASDPVEAAQCYNFWDKLLKCFSLQNNWRSLMEDSTPPNSINVINGIKYVKMRYGMQGTIILWNYLLKIYLMLNFLLGKFINPDFIHFLMLQHNVTNFLTITISDRYLAFSYFASTCFGSVFTRRVIPEFYSISPKKFDTSGYLTPHLWSTLFSPSGAYLNIIS